MKKKEEDAPKIRWRGCSFLTSASPDAIKFAAQILESVGNVQRAGYRKAYLKGKRKEIKRVASLLHFIYSRLHKTTVLGQEGKRKNSRSHGI